MKILHTIASLGAKSGGIATCTYDLVKGLNDQNLNASILTLNPFNPDSDKVLGEDPYIFFCENDSLTPYCYSRNFSKSINDFEDYDVFHTNGLWLHINHKTSLFSQSKHKPYIISPHGMLYPEAMAISSFRKKIFFNLIFKEDLLNAACIHVTCDKEMEYIREMGISTPIAVIPNPLIVPDYINSIKVKIGRKKRIGFLGRLHPIKNIDKLIYAWAKLGSKTNHSELIIIGKGDDKYEDFLKKEVLRLGLTNVSFIDFLNGKEKYEMIASLTSLVLPSKSENFGMTVLEALLMGIPAIASKGTPWEILNQEKCGWWIDIDSLSKTLDIAINLSEEDQMRMGKSGRSLVKNNFSIDQVSLKMKILYQWVLNKKSQKPDFVYL